MNSDFLMPVQGSSIGTMGRTPRPLRTLALAAAGLALSAAILVPSRLVAPVGYQYSSCCGPARGMAAIIGLCRVGQSADAVRLADSEIYRAGSNTALAGEIHYLRGGALRLQGREDEAQIDYALAASLSCPDSTPASQLDFRSQSGDFEASNRIARDILSSDTNEAGTINNACWEMTMHPGGDPARAARAMEPIAKTTDHWGYVDTYAWSLFRSDRIQEAIQQEQRALSLINSNNLDEYFYCAACLEGFQGQHIEAAQRLRSVFQHNIANTSAWDASEAFSEGRSATIITSTGQQVNCTLTFVGCPMHRL